MQLLPRNRSLNPLIKCLPIGMLLDVKDDQQFYNRDKWYVQSSGSLFCRGIIA